MMENEEIKKRGVGEFNMVTDDKADDITATPVILQKWNLSFRTLLRIDTLHLRIEQLHENSLIELFWFS